MATDKKSAGKKSAEEVKKTVEEQTETKENIKQENKPEAKKAPTVAKRSAKKESERPDPEESIESAIGRTEKFIYENGKSLMTALVVILLIAGGFFAYWYLYLPNRTEKAGDMMFVAQQQFEIDSFSIALSGDGNNVGFIQVIEKYGSTPEGNIANHYAGICYLKLGDMDNALHYLEKYDATKGSPNEIINAQNFGLQGDIFVQKGEYDKAVDKYNKAVSASDNSFTTPVYLKKLGLVYQKLGKHEDAKEAFQRIANEFSMSMEARDIEKYLGQEEQK